MKATLDHISINVSDLANSVDFYNTVLVALGFSKIKDDEGWVNDVNGIWINQTENSRTDKGFHRKNSGVNHIAFSVNSHKDVDHFFKEVIKANDIPFLYGGPKEYPDYHEGYYAVFFEDPDRLKLEVMTMNQ
ncbi:MAG: VOC family protein [Candidatus Nomurabacteria bacterium]|nr:VOC family protein [Candidatus Nomurabacteria bacterium]